MVSGSLDVKLWSLRYIFMLLAMNKHIFVVLLLLIFAATVSNTTVFVLLCRSTKLLDMELTDTDMDMSIDMQLMELITDIMLQLMSLPLTGIMLLLMHITLLLIMLLLPNIVWLLPNL